MTSKCCKNILVAHEAIVGWLAKFFRRSINFLFGANSMKNARYKKKCFYNRTFVTSTTYMITYRRPRKSCPSKELFSMNWISFISKYLPKSSFLNKKNLELLNSLEGHSVREISFGVVQVYTSFSPHIPLPSILFCNPFFNIFNLITSKLSSVSLGFLVVSRTGKTQYNEPLKIGHHGDRGDWLVAVMGRWGSNMAPASFSYSKSATFLIF